MVRRVEYETVFGYFHGNLRALTGCCQVVGENRPKRACQNPVVDSVWEVYPDNDDIERENEPKENNPSNEPLGQTEIEGVKEPSEKGSYHERTESRYVEPILGQDINEDGR